jgi:2-polyprenyl-3-methyl-5-hydroxy-6-metoxy-1,4-benzoquinol methylase
MTPPPFVSPATGTPLVEQDGALVAEGETYPVRDGIPRFVDDPGYAASFGEQWNRYRQVQLDSVTGKPHSRNRLRAGTGWTRADLEGKRVLEVGCGAGRFTEVLLAEGAEVVAVDATSAVDACLANNGPSPHLTVVQADLFALPFPPGSFDVVFCYGVIQHTPDPRAAFDALVEQARPGGLLAVDSYRKLPYVDRWSSKYLWRPLTRRLPTALLRRVVEWYVPRWLPIDTRLARVPKLGRFLVALIPCWNYTGLLDLTPSQLRAWAILDTFDALAPGHDEPQTLEQVEAWCAGAPLVDVDVRYGGNGVLVNARKRA